MSLSRRVGFSILILSFWTINICHSQDVCDENLTVGLNYAVEGRYTEAREAFRNALRADPSCQPGKEALKVVEDVTGKRIESEAASHFFRGALYGRRGQHDQAISDFNKAIEVAPMFAEAYINRGIVYAQGKSDMQMAVCLRSAIVPIPLFSPTNSA